MSKAPQQVLEDLGLTEEDATVIVEELGIKSLNDLRYLREADFNYWLSDCTPIQARKLFAKMRNDLPEQADQSEKPKDQVSVRKMRTKKELMEVIMDPHRSKPEKSYACGVLYALGQLSESQRHDEVVKPGKAHEMLDAQRRNEVSRLLASLFTNQQMRTFWQRDLKLNYRNLPEKSVDLEKYAEIVVAILEAKGLLETQEFWVALRKARFIRQEDIDRIAALYEF